MHLADVFFQSTLLNRDLYAQDPGYKYARFLNATAPINCVREIWTLHLTQHTVM